jgi:hypothetical protein
MSTALAVSWIIARASLCCSVLPVGTIAAFSRPSSKASRISFRVLSQSRTFRGRM